MGWPTTAMAWAARSLRSKSRMCLHWVLLWTVCAKREMEECCQDRDEMALYWWVHLRLWESAHSQQTTTERYQVGTTVHQRTCRICKESNDRQVSDLWKGQEGSPPHHRSTETPSLNLQKEEWHMDRHTWTDTESTPTKCPETHKSHALLQGEKEAKESMTSTVKGSRERGRNRSTLVYQKSQYVLGLSKPTKCCVRNTDGQPKSQ